MFSLSPPMSASVGSSYYKKEGYYTGTYAGASQWYGAGAQELGLSGAVNDKDFDIILYGFNPQTSAPLVRNAGKDNRRSCYDGTFSAPKSVSILAYCDKKIEKLHNEAVEETISKIEKEYAYTRQAEGETGEMRATRTSNLVMARFNHYESRELDPQLHSHILISNLTQGKDGNWRSIEPKKIFEDQMYFGLIYRSKLAQKLENHGYKIKMTDLSKGLFEVDGVPHNLIEAASKRRKQVLAQRQKNDEKWQKSRDNLAPELEKYGYKIDDVPKDFFESVLIPKELISKYNKYNEYKELSEAGKNERATQDSKRVKPDGDIKEIRAEILRKLEQEFGRPLEELRNLALQAATVPRSPPLLLPEYVQLALEDIIDKQSAFREYDVISHAIKKSMGYYGAEELIGELYKQPGLEFLGRVGRADREYYTTAEVRAAEEEIIRYAQHGRGQARAAITPEAMKMGIASVEATGKQLSTGQKNAVEMICTTRDRVSLVQGDAGAGKTFAMETVSQILSGEGISVRGFAPTGVAARELNDAGVGSMTIDKFFEIAKHQEDAAGRGEVWLVDESGMIGSRKMRRFLELAEKYDAKVVFIGDTKQFQSIEQGKIFQDLQNKTGVAKAEITEVKRQKTEHLKTVVAAIKNKDFQEAFELLDEHSELPEIADRESRINYLVNEYLQDWGDKTNSIILTGVNADRNEINKKIRDRLVATGAITGGGVYDTFVQRDTGKLDKKHIESYNVGQIVIFRDDCGQVGKGTQATIQATDAENNSIRVRYYNRDKKQYDYANIDIRKHTPKYDIYDVVRKDFGVGDKVIFTKNDSRVGVSNGQTGTIKEIRDDGTARIKIGKKEVECNLHNRGSNGYTYLDYAYCITNHKSQGASYDKVIINADVSGQRTNYNAFYVQATRAKYGIKIVTDNKKKLMEQAQIRQDKISTLDFVDDAIDKAVDKFDEILEEALEARRETDTANVANICEMLNNIQKAKEAEAQKQIADTINNAIKIINTQPADYSLYQTTRNKVLEMSREIGYTGNDIDSIFEEVKDEMKSVYWHTEGTHKQNENGHYLVAELRNPEEKVWGFITVQPQPDDTFLYCVFRGRSQPNNMPQTGASEKYFTEIGEAKKYLDNRFYNRAVLHLAKDIMESNKEITSKPQEAVKSPEKSDNSYYSR